MGAEENTAEACLRESCSKGLSRHGSRRGPSTGDNTPQKDGRRHMDHSPPPCALLMLQGRGNTLHQCGYQSVLPFSPKDELVTKYYQTAEKNQQKEKD